ncbi:hypothetical protein GQX74_008969 [Glossina fuscipes]|nr:hypothetical protein GQX74_008969 [Glossina fuscipes]
MKLFNQQSTTSNTTSIRNLGDITRECFIDVSDIEVDNHLVTRSDTRFTYEPESKIAQNFAIFSLAAFIFTLAVAKTLVETAMVFHDVASTNLKKAKFKRAANSMDQVITFVMLQMQILNCQKNAKLCMHLRALERGVCCICLTAFKCLISASSFKISDIENHLSTAAWRLLSVNY